MTSSRWRDWRDLPMKVRATAFHESAHAVLAELLNWKVERLRLGRRGRGQCVLRGTSPQPWVDVAVSVVGHAAECWMNGGKEPTSFGSGCDRREAAAVFEMVGVDKADSPFAVCEVERLLWPIFTDAGVSESVKRVARELARHRFLGRQSFLRAANLGLVSLHTRRALRRFCWRTVERVHLQHL